MAERHGVASWPGVVSIQSCQYTISSGVYPGTAQLVMLPQKGLVGLAASGLPALTGDLLISDGVESVHVRDCKLDEMRVTVDGSGQRWVLTIVDRRWRWRDLGVLSGEYNLRDEHGYLYPWTLKTPTQLAALCLEAMGEVDYTVLMPDDFYPTVKWDGTNPASALQQLAENHGCAVVLDLSTNTVLVTKRGEGNALPAGSISRLGPTLKSKEHPDTILLLGDHLRYQTRMVLEAVGEEWDGTILPIHLLSYAPNEPGQAQITSLTPVAVTAGDEATVTVSGSTATGKQTSVTATVTASSSSATTLCADLVNALAVQPGFLQLATVTSSAGTLTITGATGVTLDISATMTGDADLIQKTTQVAQAPAYPWAHSQPPQYSNVVATDRLSFQQAQAKAQNSVFRWYRVVGRGFDGAPLNVPGYGPIVRVQQLLLSDSRVEQITPNPPKLIVFPSDKLKVDNEFYNGWSRDQPAVCYGSYARNINGDPNITSGSSNSPVSEQILVPFEIDPEHQLVKFAAPVYQQRNGSVQPALVWLDCAVQVRDPVTSAVKRYQGSYAFPGPLFGTGPKVIRHDDIQQNFIGQYDPQTHVLQGVKVDIPDADKRAVYYLLGEAAQWSDDGAAEAEYNGIVPQALDGAIQQVTWEVGESGARTHISRNTDHSPYVPDLPERRRLDHLSPGKIKDEAGQAAGQWKSDGSNYEDQFKPK